MKTAGEVCAIKPEDIKIKGATQWLIICGLIARILYIAVAFVPLDNNIISFFTGIFDGSIDFINKNDYRHLAYYSFAIIITFTTIIFMVSFISKYKDIAIIDENALEKSVILKAFIFYFLNIFYAFILIPYINASLPEGKITLNEENEKFFILIATAFVELLIWIFGIIKIAGKYKDVLEYVNKCEISGTSSKKGVNNYQDKKRIEDMDTLLKYKKLLDDGIITEEDFEKKKNELLKK